MVGRRTFHVPNLISLACVSSETHNLQAVFLRIYDTIRESWCQAFLTETVEIRNKLRIVAWPKPHMFCEESLGKIKFRAFPKRVGPRILSLESVDYLGTSEHYWVVEKKKKIRILISKAALVGCCKLSLYANASCDEHAVYFRRWLKWLAMWITFLIFGNAVISLDLYTRIACDRRLFPVVANTPTKSISCTILDVDKVGSKKPLASTSCFV